MLKKLDTETVIVICICGVLLISWNYLFGPGVLDWAPKPKPNKAEVVKGQVTPSAEPSDQKKTSDKPISQEPKPTTTAAPGNEPSSSSTLQSTSIEAQQKASNNIKNIEPVELSNDLVTVLIQPTTGQIETVRLSKFLKTDRKEVVALNDGISPGALAITFPNSNLELTEVKVESVGKDSLVLRRRFQSQEKQTIDLIQTWRLTNDYVISYSVCLQNDGDKEFALPEILFWAGAIPPVKYLSGDYVIAGESHGADRCMAINDAVIETRGTDAKFEERGTQDNPVKWIGVSNKYFTSVLKPSAPFPDGSVCRRVEKQAVNAKDASKENYFVIYTAGAVKRMSIPARSSKTWDFSYFSGPKSISLLKQFDPNAPYIMHLAWKYIDGLSICLLYCLIFFKDFSGSYGWAIIILTVVVKLLFWPITHKSNVSMKKMQKIQPMVAELREKYKNDKQKMNTQLMELYKREKVNPIGGCLPILLQIPVFIALYWTLDGAIELRHTNFLWASDLTRPDTVNALLGLPDWVSINPLAIFMCVTMFIQQRMTPTAMDPVQEKMMLFMPIIMLFFLYNLPSGLTLYWTVSQIISIGQLFFNKHLENKGMENAKPA